MHVETAVCPTLQLDFLRVACLTWHGPGPPHYSWTWKPCDYDKNIISNSAYPMLYIYIYIYICRPFTVPIQWHQGWSKSMNVPRRKKRENTKSLVFREPCVWKLDTVINCTSVTEYRTLLSGHNRWFFTLPATFLIFSCSNREHIKILSLLVNSVAMSAPRSALLVLLVLGCVLTCVLNSS